MKGPKHLTIWIYGEREENGRLAPVVEELACEARRLLGEDWSGTIGIMTFSEGVPKVLEQANSWCVDQVVCYLHAQFDSYDTEIFTETLSFLFAGRENDIVLFGATTQGRDLASRLAARLQVGLTADCTGLALDSDGRLEATRPTFGGTLFATIKFCSSIQMATVRPKTFKLGGVLRQTPEHVMVPVHLVFANRRIVKVNKVADQLVQSIRLEEAEIIVAGGRGAQTQEGFAIIEEFARSIGGAVGASRAAVDAGWRPHTDQVGQTGKTVSPKVYFACGISGAVQHLVGMSSAAVVIAINTNPAAPIFRHATFGIVGNLFEVLPQLQKELVQRRASFSTNKPSPKL